MVARPDNHYDYLEEHLPNFFDMLGIGWEGHGGIVLAHGDKAYAYRSEWESFGIPFNHGVAIYLLSYCTPYDREVRETANGWVAPKDWVIANYDRFRCHLPE